LGKRRTNPGYLSDDEAARDRARTAACVRSFVHSNKFTLELSGDKEFKRTWYAGRLCDSCGKTLQMMSWRCKKCDIAFCNKCSRELEQIQKKSFACCPMCDGRLE